MLIKNLLEISHGKRVSFLTIIAIDICAQEWGRKRSDISKESSLQQAQEPQ